MKMLFRRIAGRILRKRAYLLFEQACMGVPDPEVRPGELFHVLSKDSCDAQSSLGAALVATAADNADYLADVRRGRVVALAITRDGKLVHYSYLFLRNKTACILGLSETSALIGNAFTLPGCRGLGYQGRAVQARASLAAKAGYSHIVAETAPDNLASQRGMLKGGMRLVGRMDVVVVFNVFVLRWRRPAGVKLFGLCL